MSRSCASMRSHPLLLIVVIAILLECPRFHFGYSRFTGPRCLRGARVDRALGRDFVTAEATLTDTSTDNVIHRPILQMIPCSPVQETRGQPQLRRGKAAGCLGNTSLGHCLANVSNQLLRSGGTALAVAARGRIM